MGWESNSIQFFHKLEQHAGTSPSPLSPTLLSHGCRDFASCSSSLLPCTYKLLIHRICMKRRSTEQCLNTLAQHLCLKKSHRHARFTAPISGQTRIVMRGQPHWILSRLSDAPLHNDLGITALIALVEHAQYMRNLPNRSPCSSVKKAICS